MESDLCEIYQSEFDLTDFARTPIELPCEHEICAQCYLAKEATAINADRINCLVCDEQFKFTKAYRKLLNEARGANVVNTSPLLCQKHPD